MARLLLIACLFVTLATLAIAHKRDPPTTTPKPRVVPQKKLYNVLVQEPSCEVKGIARLNLICEHGRPESNAFYRNVLKTSVTTGECRKLMKIELNEFVVPPMCPSSAARG